MIPEISVPVAMLVGVALGMLLVRPNIKETTCKSSAVLAMACVMSWA